MSGSKPVVYLDTCPVLAWLNEEERHGAGVLTAMGSLISQASDGKIKLAYSSILNLEILKPATDQEAAHILDIAFSGKGAYSVSVTEPIVKEAIAIRRRLLNARDGQGLDITVGAADALHLACAAYAEADWFVTLDGRFEERVPTQRWQRKLLPLCEMLVGGKTMKIVMPNDPRLHRGQRLLDLP